MGEVKFYERAMLDTSGKVPIFYTDHDRTVYYKDFERSLWFLFDCTHEVVGDLHTFRGEVPQYEFCCVSRGGQLGAKEITEEEAAYYHPKSIQVGKRFWSGKEYKYVDGWTRIKENKAVCLTVFGGLIIISDCGEEKPE